MRIEKTTTPNAGIASGAVSADPPSALDRAIAGIVDHAAKFHTIVEMVDMSARLAYRDLVEAHGRTPATTSFVNRQLTAVRRGLKAASTQSTISPAEKSSMLAAIAIVDAALTLHAKACADFQRRTLTPLKAVPMRRPTRPMTCDAAAATPIKKRARGDHRRRPLRIVFVNRRTASTWRR